jgi:methionyl-tRNA synthetase
MLSFAYKRFDGVVPEPGDPSSSFPRSASGQAGQGLDDEDRALLEKVEAGFEAVGDLYNACKFRAALHAALALAREANGYTFATLSAGLDRKAPWFQIKEDRQAAATTVYVILRVVDNLKTILAPILPHTPVLTHMPVLAHMPVLTHRAQKQHEYLGYEGQLAGTQHVVEYQKETRSHRALTCDHSGAVGTWAKSVLPPEPLFKKLDESVIEEEYARLER